MLPIPEKLRKSIIIVSIDLSRGKVGHVGTRGTGGNETPHRRPRGGGGAPAGTSPFSGSNQAPSGQCRSKPTRLETRGAPAGLELLAAIGQNAANMPPSLRSPRVERPPPRADTVRQSKRAARTASRSGTRGCRPATAGGRGISNARLRTTTPRWHCPHPNQRGTPPRSQRPASDRGRPSPRTRSRPE